MGPSAIVRAVGRALRSVVGGDSDDAPQQQQQQHPLVWPLHSLRPYMGGHLGLPFHWVFSSGRVPHVCWGEHHVLDLPHW